MRIFSILAALVVTVLLAMSILARPQLMALLGMSGDAEETQTNTLNTGEADAENAASQNLVKVLVRKVIAEQVDSAVILRGQTAAARQVDVKSETSAIVASAPLRKGSSVVEGQALCVLDPGTRGSALEEARARLTEAQSRVPESEARVEEARARLEEAKINQNADAEACGSIQTISATIIPAGMARQNDWLAPIPVACWDNPSIAGIRSGDSAGVNTNRAAAAKAPTTLAPKTMPHRRIIQPKAYHVRSCMIGKTVVIVFSVNSCMRPMITAKKPSE